MKRRKRVGAYRARRRHAEPFVRYPLKAPKDAWAYTSPTPRRPRLGCLALVLVIGALAAIFALK